MRGQKNKEETAVLQNGFVELLIWNILFYITGLVYFNLHVNLFLSKLGRDVVF